MKTKNEHLTALACVMLFGSVAISPAAIIWQTDFNSYTAGNLSGQAVGGGFSGNWFGASGTVSVSGGVATGTGNIRAALGNTFSDKVGATGTLWVSFDWGHDTSREGFGGLSFFNSGGTERQPLIGNGWISGNLTWGLAAVGSMTTILPIGLKTGVAKIKLNGEGDTTVVDLWVGATGSPVDVSGAPMATRTNGNLSDVNTIRIMGNNAQKFDNLVIGTTMADVDAIPEPATFGIVLSALAAAVIRRRRVL